MGFVTLIMLETKMITSLAWDIYSFLQILVLHGVADVNAINGHQILVLNLSLLLHMEK
jgi:hypothetical protein